MELGYLEGLKGEQIPIAARITSVADAFDAMISPRIYKSGRKIEDVFADLKKDSGTYFDPQIVEVLLTLKPELEERYKEIFI